MKARNIMSGNVVTVSSTASIPEVARILVERGFTSIPVVDDDDGRLVGIVSEADLLRGWGVASATPGHRSGRTVADVMTTPVESLAPGADASALVAMMIDERVRCIPITEGPGVVGVITLRDLLRTLILDAPGGDLRP
jgi:CBS domain-containing protein